MLHPSLEKSALSVSAVAFFISNLLKNHLGSLIVCGEISGLRRGGRGSYIYFSLIDEKSKIECLTHISSAGGKALQALNDGDRILVFAQPSFYGAGGKLSFFTDEILKLGEGLFGSAVEELRKKLYAEGLFAEDRKKTLPLYPQHVGIVTSAEGAVVHDIIRIAKDRWPLVELSLFPALVQGEKAPQSLLSALENALSHPLEAIIIGRGGGSSDDLSAFNDEELVRAIANAEIPIVSAVGHEIDLSLCDFAADYSAPTPTGAAMKLFPDKNDVEREIQSTLLRIRRAYHQYLSDQLDETENIINNIRQYWKQTIQEHLEDVYRLNIKIENAHPERILERGYALVLDNDGQRAEYFQPEQQITILTSGRTVRATVNEASKRQ
ncbi:MAG: exodeoxyribonuclease VII large subunit [Brevinema sp.]